MKILIDTNLFIRLASQNHGLLLIARSAIERLEAENHIFVLVPQVLYEFWVVATRPRERNGLGMTVENVAETIDRMIAYFSFQNDNPQLFEVWKGIVLQHRVSGKPAHDARLVAAAQIHGCEGILTFNADDFRRYSGLKIFRPEEVAAGKS